MPKTVCSGSSAFCTFGLNKGTDPFLAGSGLVVIVAIVAILLMIQNLHYLQDLTLWELWHIPSYG